MSNSRFKFSKEKLEEMKGFEEVLDLVNAPKGDGPKISTKFGTGGHDLYHFLEIEKTRLEKLDQLFSVQIHNLNTNSQTHILVSAQEKKLKIVKARLSERLVAPNSILNQNLSGLFDNAFKKYSE